jgi:hypothetical protein
VPAAVCGGGALGWKPPSTTNPAADSSSPIPAGVSARALSVSGAVMCPSAAQSSASGSRSASAQGE